MPERGMDLRRIGLHLGRHLLLYLVGALALMFLNNLVYTLTRPGYSEDETLKIMLVNVSLNEDIAPALLEGSNGRYRAVEIEELPIGGDPSSRMLLLTQLISGFGDIYICDGAGYEILLEREAVAGGGWVQLSKNRHICVMKNGTDVPGAMEMLPVLTEIIEE